MRTSILNANRTSYGVVMVRPHRGGAERHQGSRRASLGPTAGDVALDGAAKRTRPVRFLDMAIAPTAKQKSHIRS